MVKCSSRGGCTCEHSLWFLSKPSVVRHQCDANKLTPRHRDAKKLLLAAVGGGHLRASERFPALAGNGACELFSF